MLFFTIPGAAEQVRQTRRPPVSSEARSTRIVCTDLCPNVRHRVWTSFEDGRERADFERGGHTFSAGVAIRLNTRQNYDRLACVAPSRGSPGA